MVTTWNSSIIPVNVLRETIECYYLANGTRVNKRSLTQFIGESKEEAKQKLINKLKEDRDRQISAWDYKIKKAEEIE